MTYAATLSNKAQAAGRQAARVLRGFNLDGEKYRAMSWIAMDDYIATGKVLDRERAKWLIPSFEVCV